uniref:Uncharacterized protein n=1 Tax=Zea mays TaxID=4577 RepID=C0PCA0_MAIZE|nr:unknown [Zea mays]
MWQTQKATIGQDSHDVHAVGRLCVSQVGFFSFWVFCVTIGSLWAIRFGSAYAAESEGYPFADKVANVASLQQHSRSTTGLAPSPFPNRQCNRVSLNLISTPSTLSQKRKSRNQPVGITLTRTVRNEIPLSANSSSYKITSS